MVLLLMSLTLTIIEIVIRLWVSKLSLGYGLSYFLICKNLFGMLLSGRIPAKLNPVEAKKSDDRKETIIALPWSKTTTDKLNYWPCESECFPFSELLRPSKSAMGPLICLQLLINV